MIEQQITEQEVKERGLPITLTIKEAATLSGIGINRMYELAHIKDFPRIKIGGKIIVETRAFLNWLHEQAAAHADIAV